MNRNEVTTADKLVKGDRFYKFKGKKEEVYQVVDEAFGSSQIKVKTAKSRFDEMLKKNAQVVFLRHIEEVITK